MSGFYGTQCIEIGYVGTRYLSHLFCSKTFFLKHLKTLLVSKGTNFYHILGHATSSVTWP